MKEARLGETRGCNSFRAILNKASGHMHLCKRKCLLGPSAQSLLLSVTVIQVPMGTTESLVQMFILMGF